MPLLQEYRFNGIVLHALYSKMWVFLLSAVLR